jgi:hypothetical protein
MKPDQLASNIENIILKAIQDFDEGLASSQVNAYNKLIALMKEISIDSKGLIKRTAANVKVLKGITKALNETLLTPTYKARVAKYLRAYDTIENEQLLYFKTIKASFEASAMLETIKSSTIESVVSSLTEIGLEEYFTKPLKEIIYRNISTGGSYAEFQQEIREYIIGTPEVEGRFLKYTRQITNDTISSYNAQYNQSASQDLGLVFYKYLGGKKDTTRAFCEERYGKFFHIEEVKGWGRGERCCGLSWPQNKKWAGMRKGTNENNILIFRGGYLCRHQIIAVSEAIVPETVINRAIQEGYLNKQAA